MPRPACRARSPDKENGKGTCYSPDSRKVSPPSRNSAFTPIDLSSKRSLPNHLTPQVVAPKTVHQMKGSPFKAVRRGRAGVGGIGKLMVADVMVAAEAEAVRNGHYDGFPVHLHVYDLGLISKWMLNSWATHDMGLGGAYHCGVEVLGFEWSFRASACGEPGVIGVTGHRPIEHPRFAFRETIKLGDTPMSVPEVGKLLADFGKNWPSSSYHLLCNNCTDFAAAFVAALRVPYKFPEWVYGIAKGSLVQQALRASNTLALPGCGYAISDDDRVLNQTDLRKEDLPKEAALPT